MYIGFTDLHVGRLDVLVVMGWGVLVLAMVFFSKSPKTSRSSLSQWGKGERGLVQA